MTSLPPFPKFQAHLPANASGPVHASLQEAIAAGAVPGSLLIAPLAPKDGPITVVSAPIAATKTSPAVEPMVVVGVRSFWDSPTIKKARGIVIACAVIGLSAAGFIVQQAMAGGTTIFKVPWGAAGTAGVTAFVGALITAFFAWQKTQDHNVAMVSSSPAGTALIPERKAT